VSKRSYRRLAVVAGAALAVGSMAPAMAARIDSDATVSANAIDATELAGSLIPDLPVVNTAVVGQLSASLLGTPFAVLGRAQTTVNQTLGCTGALLSSGIGLGFGAEGTAGLGLGGLNLDVAGALTAPVEAATGVVGCATGAVVPGALGIVGTAAAPAGIVANAALQTVGSLPATVGQATGTVFGLQDLLLGGGLDSILSVNVLAGVMGSL
jgi:hypothetical protein